MSEMEMSGRAAAEIRSQLGRQNLTKSELARRLKVSHTWVTNRITGSQEIGLNELQRIALALDVPVTKLLGDINDTTRATRQKLSTAPTEQREPCRATGRRPLNISSATRRPRVISSEVAA